MSEEADVIVIGMGPGGENIAETLASAGLSVVGIENNLIGGECPYWGCIPSKMMIRAASMIAEARRIPQLAGDSTVTPDWSMVASRIRREATDGWNDRVAAGRFINRGGRLYRGWGRLVGPNEVQVGNDRIRARTAVVIATGSAPAVPSIEGLDTVPYWTNHEAIEVDALPKSLIVMGGGAIGAELAQVFARFGVKVTIIERNSRILSREEPEASATVAQAFQEDGITLETGKQVVAVSGDEHNITVHLDSGASVTGEKLLVAIGRKVDLTNLGVEAIGCDPNAKSLEIDENCSVAPHVYGVGDVTGKGAFTHVSMYQSQIVIDHILGRPHAPAQYHALPRVTFTDPEVGSAGMTEAQARNAGVTVEIGMVDMASVTRGWIHKAGGAGFIKLIMDADAGYLVGATVAGPNGGEVLGLLALAVHQRTPVQDLKSMMYAYPTFHRGIESALRTLG